MLFHIALFHQIHVGNGRQLTVVINPDYCLRSGCMRVLRGAAQLDRLHGQCMHVLVNTWSRAWIIWDILLRSPEAIYPIQPTWPCVRLILITRELYPRERVWVAAGCHIWPPAPSNLAACRASQNLTYYQDDQSVCHILITLISIHS